MSWHFPADERGRGVLGRDETNVPNGTVEQPYVRSSLVNSAAVYYAVFQFLSFFRPHPAGEITQTQLGLALKK